MLKKKTNIRAAMGVLFAVLAIFATITFVDAQTPTPVPEATASPFTEPPSPISHSIISFTDCLACHADGVQKAKIIPADHSGYSNDGCQDCHESSVSQITPAWENSAAGVPPAPISHPPVDDDTEQTCYTCHLELGDEHTDVASQWKDSVHGKAGIGCADCHGGDPRTDEMSLAMDAEAGYIGVPLRTITPQICGGCHADVDRMRAYNLPTDQYAKYFQSVHGSKLQEGDIRVAICTDCHGTHNIKKGSDTTADVYPLNVPALCARCHSDTDLMEAYGIRTDQFELYEASIHGELLLGDQDVRAPTCASCHGSHDAKPPTDEEVINVCGKCHTATEELYQQSLHSRLGHNAPKCWTCHGTHDVFKTDESMFLHHEPQEEQHCGTCHMDDKTFRMEKVRFERKEDRRCDTCHHEGSRIMRQVLGIHSDLSQANELYEEAEMAIQRAGSLGMIVTDAEAKLAEARTSLVRARAAVHTTKLPVVSSFTDDALELAGNANNLAEEKLGENLFRRLSSMIAVAIILLIIAALYILKRDLYGQLEAAEVSPGPAGGYIDASNLEDNQRTGTESVTKTDGENAD